ncbi:hypothetical protein HK100_012945 [Physocladia obscura]|uniref:Protein kinase domain-containing protein n=1 Tax=Physocladia obscura TaxID=109957 RepID=A0AAD5SYZ5_9FUNG|nr:hypothetical protein HK100_012945 [Physocladia obscura]
MTKPLAASYVSTFLCAHVPLSHVAPGHLDLFKCDYKTGRILGNGTFGTVKEAIKISTGEKYALKVINKNHMRGREQLVRNEVKILKGISRGHRHIVTLHEYFETPNSLYLVLDLCSGGELFEYIMEKGSFYEENAAEIIRTVLDCVAYLHENNVVHRDIKEFYIHPFFGDAKIEFEPENLLFRSKDSLSQLMISDFGLSQTLETPDMMLSTKLGTPTYMAPEIFLHKGYGKPVDLWAIGVMTYFLLCGFFPFALEGGIVDEKVLRAEFYFEEPYWLDISSEAKDFISKLLCLNPNDRMTAIEAMKHPWMAFAPIQLGDGSKISSRVPTVDLLPAVGREFSKRSTLRKNPSAKTNPSVQSTHVVLDAVASELVTHESAMDVEYVNREGALMVQQSLE